MDDFISVIQVVSIVTLIIQIIVLIVFFVLSANVAKIKNHLTMQEDFDDLIEMAEEEKYIGNIGKAKEILLRLEYKAKKRMGEISDSQYYYQEQEKEMLSKRMENIKVQISGLNKD